MSTRGFQGRRRPTERPVLAGQSVTDGIVSATFDWESFHELPMETITADIHCVTHWSKLDTTWRGVPMETLFDAAGVGDFDFALVSSYGGPVRLVVPHLYFWKSAKWLSGIQLGDDEEQCFWEAAGYHNYGDPWSEQRYSSDWLEHARSAASSSGVCLAPGRCR
jgi:DMSO/TMAO reductase YedYZ molybdopterin-dependent catalytic subunit